MALIAVSGQPGCRFEEVARISAHRLGFELVNESRIHGLIEREFGADAEVPPNSVRLPLPAEDRKPLTQVEPGLLVGAPVSLAGKFSVHTR